MFRHDIGQVHVRSEFRDEELLQVVNIAMMRALDPRADQLKNNLRGVEAIAQF